MDTKRSNPENRLDYSVKMKHIFLTFLNKPGKLTYIEHAHAESINKTSIFFIGGY